MTDAVLYGGTQRPPPHKLTPLFPREFTGKEWSQFLGRWPLCTTVVLHRSLLRWFRQTLHSPRQSTVPGLLFLLSKKNTGKLTLTLDQRDFRAVLDVRRRSPLTF